ncbi:hydroxyisourate hydrolase [Granulibacter bethesdensis]|uniref:5-hydroxyisourate hydrolase n=1 Tax=Granulibacter bethesdensis (strain ATCC BAA-1260 / CGDNIH1) TaxID=391165 RepID=Q0BSR1_GRABC|nr:hydroxyisourate hydrolase [Granulibacter bethesdensis]ABI62141.1 Urate oxidase [Granulibacter bethesdensis CGDNIH1]AHJ68955.1 Urate oxidase [Granulibacter bethesdensis]APH51968.1 Urate oxidase [Granulibacter bethesdensis]APH64658.1 Urate oxidase [Granulibacter bethesdensis]
MGQLTTHVLDTARGRPAAGIPVRLYRQGEPEPLITTITNSDGRCDAPLLQGAALIAGRYELAFDVGAYFAARDSSLPDPPFLETVRLAVGLSDPSAHYHVPLLVSPWGYTTYRGS